MLLFLLTLANLWVKSIAILRLQANQILEKSDRMGLLLEKMKDM